MRIRNNLDTRQLCQRPTKTEKQHLFASRFLNDFNPDLGPPFLTHTSDVHEHCILVYRTYSLMPVPKCRVRETGFSRHRILLIACHSIEWSNQWILIIISMDQTHHLRHNKPVRNLLCHTRYVCTARVTPFHLPLAQRLQKAARRAVLYVPETPCILYVCEYIYVLYSCTHLLTKTSKPFLRSSIKSSSNIPSSPRKGIWRFHAFPGKGGTTIYNFIKKNKIRNNNLIILKNMKP